MRRLPRRSASEGGRFRLELAAEQGAIAQLGERLLCKQEVVGSIPSGSTSLRRSAASAWQAGVTEGCRAVAFAKAGQDIVREIQIRTSFIPTG